MNHAADPTSLTLSRATLVLDASIAKAQELGIAISAAVCNREGRLTAFKKMDGAGPMTGHEALRRAVAAAGSGEPSEVSTPAGAFKTSRVSTVENEGIGCSHQRGALPLTCDGEDVGAIGVCGGGDHDQDVACARAGARVLLDAATGCRGGVDE